MIPSEMPTVKVTKKVKNSIRNSSFLYLMSSNGYLKSISRITAPIITAPKIDFGKK